MPGNIFTAINTIMGQVGYVKKQRAANLNYTYAGEAALISALRPEMVENGVFCHVADVRNITTREYQTSKGTQMVNVTLTAVIRFYHAESGTWIDVVACGEGSDTGDKATNKAMTGAYKYALRQTFCIETGDDPDRFQPTEKSNGAQRQAAPVDAEMPAPKMSREAAEAMTNKDGIAYGSLDSDTLSNMTIGISKALKKEGLVIADKERLQMKLDAIAAILYYRQEVVTSA